MTYDSNIGIIKEDELENMKSLEQEPPQTQEMTFNQTDKQLTIYETLDKAQEIEQQKDEKISSKKADSV